MCKRDEFLIWVELHHPDEVIDEAALEEIIEKSPKMSFPKILKKVTMESGPTQPAEVMVESTLAGKALLHQGAPLEQTEVEEKHMLDADIIADPVGTFEEGMEALKDVPGLEEFNEYLATDAGKKQLEIGARAAAANLHTTNCRLHGKAADKYAATIVQEAAIWSQRNPKTAAAVGVGAVALAGYGTYKLITKYVL